MPLAALGSLGGLPVPLFGTLRQAVQFGLHHAGSLPRFAPWGLAVPMAGLWLVWPALTQDFKANNFMVGQTLEAEAEARAVVTDAASKATSGIDYTSTGALQSFKTREGVKNKFASDSVDGMPKNLDEDAAEAIMKATEASHASDVHMAESVDALRRFNTRAGAKFEYNASEIDKTPALGGAADDDEDDDDE
jgi:hypothetical protein